MASTHATSFTSTRPRSEPRLRPALPSRRARELTSRQHGALRRAHSERALVLAAKRGGARERERLIEAFRPSIAGIARGYRRQQAVTWMERMQEGTLGLLRALERYDPQRGTPFWAYASWWVRQAMQQVVSELSGPVVLSDRALRQLARIKAAQRRFEQRAGREPSCAELAEAAGLPREQVVSLMRADRAPRALEEPAGGHSTDTTTTVGDLVADPPAEDAFERVPQRLCASQLPRLFAQLSDRERTVLFGRYGIGSREHTLQEIGAEIGVSAERVRQIEQDSLQKLYLATHMPRGQAAYA
jgi:RNA polymerase sigma factor (sigma-70 family)